MNWKYFYILSLNIFSIKLSTGSFYSYDKNVIELTQGTFRDFIFNKDYASLVEFYNSFCGACRRYSQTWKSFALDISSWNDIVKVAGVDCSENDILCRNHDIHYYPSIRYFSPYLKDDPEEHHTGQQSTAREISVMKALTVNYLQNETNIPKHWPDLQPLMNITEPEDLFSNVPDDVKFILLVYPGVTNVHIGYELTLDYHKVKDISIKQINSSETATILGLDSKSTIHAIGRDLKIEKLPTEIYHNHKAIKRIIEKYLLDHGIFIKSEVDQSDTNTIRQVNNNDTLSNDEKQILKTVRNMTQTVFQADLERALKQSLTTEIYNHNEIKGERLSALRNYVAVIKKYSPLGDSGHDFFEELTNFINSSGDTIDGTLYKLKIQDLENKAEFFADRWIGCQGSTSHLRGYSCGLWTLYHYLTVRAAASDNDPIEVLESIHDYTKHFFGCTECAVHFEKMAAEEHMWNVTSKSQAIIWLWKAHNNVNDRLSGDVTDDPLFPKIKFPSLNDCPLCRNGIFWVEDEVLAFLKEMHSDNKISRYGIGSIGENVTPQSIQNDFNGFKENIILENLSSIIVIGFCVCILFIVASMFIPRRQKYNISLNV